MSKEKEQLPFILNEIAIIIKKLSIFLTSFKNNRVKTSELMNYDKPEQVIVENSNQNIEITTNEENLSTNKDDNKENIMISNDNLNHNQENVSMKKSEETSKMNEEKINKSKEIESKISVLNNFAFMILLTIMICSNLTIWLSMAY